MESNGEAEKKSSYRYWVRESTCDAAPLPQPRKLENHQPANHNNSLGSVWNQAGTWEEKNLNKWATERIKELLMSVGSLEFLNGKAYIEEVSKCIGDAFLVIVRNKKKVGYTCELSLKFKGEWLIRNENNNIKGYINIAEFSFGELDDLEIEVRFSEGNDLPSEDKTVICKDLKLFFDPIREKLQKFEQELQDR